MLVALIAGIAAAAGGLLWYKVVVPLDRMLQQSADLERPDWAVDTEYPVSQDQCVADTRMTDKYVADSLARLANAVRPSARSVAPVAEPVPEHIAAPHR